MRGDRIMHKSSERRGEALLVTEDELGLDDKTISRHWTVNVGRKRWRKRSENVTLTWRN